jgi:uncharacterized protein involved in exopolysaccharide biosynthesis
MERYNNKQLGGENAENENEHSFTIRDLIFMVLNNWWWFVISVFVCFVVAGFYYKSQPKTYSASGTILVRDEGNKISYSSRNMDAILNSMDMGNVSMSLENEIYMLRSSWLMNQVVQRLKLNYPCERKDLFKKVSYFEDAPLQLIVHDSAQLERDLNFSIQVTPKANNKYEFKASKC